MKMTAEEIVKIYKSDPSKETMQQLAIDNDCTLKDIGEFLKAAATAKKTEEIMQDAGAPAEEKKKPGRPKGSTNREKSVKPKELPEYVRATLEARLNALIENRQILLTSLERVNREAEEITNFLYE